MVRHRGDGVRMQVARETHLQRNLALDHLGQQGRILIQARSVADALRLADVKRLVYGARAISLPRVAGARHAVAARVLEGGPVLDRKSTRLNSSHDQISYAVFCLKQKKKKYKRKEKQKKKKAKHK